MYAVGGEFRLGLGSPGHQHEASSVEGVGRSGRPLQGELGGPEGGVAVEFAHQVRSCRAALGNCPGW